MSGTHLIDLGFPVPTEATSDFIGKLAYVSDALEKFELSGADRRNLIFRVKSGKTIAPDVVYKQILQLARDMLEYYRPMVTKILVERSGRLGTVHQIDPHPWLLENGELYDFGAGRYGLGPMLTNLIHYFEQEVYQIGMQMKAKAHQYPALIGADTLATCNYFRSFPHSLNLVSHLREDLHSIEQFAENANYSEGALHFPEGSLAKPETLLSPSVCFHTYRWMSGTRLKKPEVITALGKCFRYESGNLKGLERLWDFTMREVIFVGPGDFVLQQREESMALSVELLDRWELAYEIRNANDPFFPKDFASQVSYQDAFDLKFEIRATLPYKQSDLAIGSFNYHQDFFGRSFEILDAEGKEAHTSCLGFGLERVALAFLAQHGTSQEAWPEVVRKGMESRLNA